MSAAKAVLEGRAAGIQFRLEGDDLVLEAVSAPTPAILEQLSRHKPAIVAWLRPGPDGWSADDWHSYFDERAGIAEFDGGLSRDQAAARAFVCCVAEWLNRNPLRSPPGRCLGCGAAERSQDPLLPFGLVPTGHAWLHSRCWPTWHANRKAEAAVAISTLGIRELRTSP